MSSHSDTSARTRTGLVVGVSLALLVWFMPLSGISMEAQRCLALTLMTVTFWAFQVMQPAYAGGLFLALLVIAKVAEPAVVFRSWVGTTMYLIIGAYLIASAVKSSGLGERIAFNYLLRFVKSYRSVIVGVFVLTLVLSLLIPHPWPRAFLIMSVMAAVIKGSGIPREDAIKIGFSVFAAAVPVSLVFLTGDAVLNPFAVAASGTEIGFVDWLRIMSVPALVASALTCGLLIVLFPPSQEVRVNKGEIRRKLAELGPMRTLEKRAVLWLAVAIILWMTDGIHGVDVGWITLLVAMLMAVPGIGGVLKAEDWSSVPVQTLVFLTAAMAIGAVGTSTGMTTWIAETVLPSAAPSNLFLLAALITILSIGLHMALGSVIAGLGVAIPAILVFAEPLGVSPVAVTMIVYIAIAAHYILPYQHLDILVGASEEMGGFTQKETVRMGVPLIGVLLFVTVAVMIPWWMLVGLL